MKIYLYNFDPLKPHSYTVKLGFAGVHHFLISAQKTYIVGSCSNRLGEAVLPSSNILSVEQKYKKNIRVFLPENFPFFGRKIFNILE